MTTYDVKIGCLCHPDRLGSLIDLLEENVYIDSLPDKSPIRSGYEYLKEIYSFMCSQKDNIIWRVEA